MCFVIQFVDRICSTWMVDNNDKIDNFKDEAPPKQMLRIKMLRGNNDRVIFLETVGKSERVVSLDVNSEKIQDLNRKVILDIYDSKIVSMAPDSLNFGDDRNSKCTQSFYLINEKGTLLKVSNKTTNVYRVIKERSLEHH